MLMCICLRICETGCNEAGVVVVCAEGRLAENGEKHEKVAENRTKKSRIRRVSGMELAFHVQRLQRM